MSTTKPPDGPKVVLQKIFLKDASVEVPAAPGIFTASFQPQMEVQINTEVGKFGDDRHQVTLLVAITAKLEDKTAYLVEVQQSGVFQISGFRDAAEQQAILGAYCPNVIFPYAREAVSELIQRAGFPQFLLQPVNFDALYREYLKQAQAKSADTAH